MDEDGHAVDAWIGLLRLLCLHSSNMGQLKLPRLRVQRQGMVRTGVHCAVRLMCGVKVLQFETGQAYSLFLHTLQSHPQISNTPHKRTPQ
jgi:hypothetical protein